MKKQINNRLRILLSELREKCNEANCFEFDYYWEIWGVMWYPWTLEINGKSQSFSLNDVSSKDLDELSNVGLIELIKEYTKEEMTDEFDRKKYRLILTKGK